jgi:tetratricopeptide (TPR) repeat protein
MAHRDKLITDIQRLLKTQDFKSEEEAEKFINSLIGSPVPSFEKEALSPEEQAEDLVFEAWECPFEEGLEKVFLALSLDPDSILAYEFLAAHQDEIHLSIPFYAYGVEIGRRIFSGAFLDEHKGYFWGAVETRPFLRCMHQYAACLYAVGKTELSFSLYNEILELNPEDNQGVRNEYQLYLLESGNYQKFEEISTAYNTDSSAFASFNRVLYSFIKEGDSHQTQGLLKSAKQQNKFVTAKLLSPKPPQGIPDSHSHGSKEEAIHYVSFAWDIWHETDKAIAWLRKSCK